MRNSPSWEEIEAVLGNAPVLDLGQAWLPEPLKNFRPTRVRIAWTSDSLLVLGEMTDEDIFNPSVGLNKYAWEEGDVFEIFLHPMGQEFYWEFHVTPTNQVLQLKLPYTKTAQLRTWKNRESEVDPLKIWTPIIQTRVEVKVEKKIWRVFVEVPLKMVIQGHGRTFDPKEEWQVSFSRYDHTRGEKEPVLSSTSPHRRMSFHRLHEWRFMQFVE